MALIAAAALQAQAPTAASVVNAASYLNPRLPNGGIAQGGVFTVFGTNLGPTPFVQAGAFPISTTLAGTSMTVTVGGVSRECPMIVALATQASAILPSDTPVGEGTLRVTRPGGQATVPIKVVAHAPGVFALAQNGAGPGVLTNPGFVVNTLASSANPGAMWDAWVTGVGRIAGSDAAAPPFGDLPFDVQVTVGGRPAQVVYKGRSGCCAGLDQIRFVVPQGVTGCYVPVNIVVNGVRSNSVTMSIAAAGDYCSDPLSGLDADMLRRAQQTGRFRLADLGFIRTKFALEFGGLPMQSFDLGSEGAYADYFEFTFNELIRRQSPFESPQLGTCATYQFDGEDADLDDPIEGRGLEAGPSIALEGPGVNSTLQREERGVYYRSFKEPSIGLPFLRPENMAAMLKAAALGETGGKLQGNQGLASGRYTFRAPGGSDVPAHTATFDLLRNFNWTNRGQVQMVNRSAGQQVTWTGGAAGRYTSIFGYSAFVRNGDEIDGGGMFYCLADSAAGSFTVPANVLLQLPPSTTVEGFPIGAFGVGVFDVKFFTAPTMDLGIVGDGDLDLKMLGYN